MILMAKRCKLRCNASGVDGVGDRWTPLGSEGDSAMHDWDCWWDGTNCYLNDFLDDLYVV